MSLKFVTSVEHLLDSDAPKYDSSDMEVGNMGGNIGLYVNFQRVPHWFCDYQYSTCTIDIWNVLKISAICEMSTGHKIPQNIIDLTQDMATWRPCRFHQNSTCGKCEDHMGFSITSFQSGMNMMHFLGYCYLWVDFNVPGSALQMIVDTGSLALQWCR